MDETAMAFELPHVRASASHSGPPLDRISVRDYVRDIEIGAFRTERGVTQRVRFNVVLEVTHNAAAESDDVDQVVSYDMITDAIEAALAADRLNLLETLAERVAAVCLADPQSVRVFVRVEKLDRIPGALGVEIMRTRVPEAAPRLRPVQESAEPQPSIIRPTVIYLAREVLDGVGAAGWLDAIAGWSHPKVLCIGASTPQRPAGTEPQMMIGLLAIETAAWALSDRDPRFSVVASRTELDWSLKTGRCTVWAPPRMATAMTGHDLPDASDPLGLAGWLAKEIGAGMLVAVGAAADPARGEARLLLLDPARPEALAELD
jgi:dihydroneopterin aldolase